MTVPGLSKIQWKTPALPSGPLSKVKGAPVSLVTLWTGTPVFVQVTVEPAETTMHSGVKLKSATVTEVVATGEPPFGQVKPEPVPLSDGVDELELPHADRTRLPTSRMLRENARE